MAFIILLSDWLFYSASTKQCSDTPIPIFLMLLASTACIISNGIVNPYSFDASAYNVFGRHVNFQDGGKDRKFKLN